MILRDRFQTDAVRWTFLAAEPVAYGVSSLHALLSAPIIETLELSVAGFEAASDLRQS